MSWLTSLPAQSAGWFTWQAIPEAGLEVFHTRGKAAGPMALVTAGVHGDEYEGPAALAALAHSLSKLESVTGTVILIPVVNPLAFHAGTRTAPQDGLNLARTFPGAADGSEMERLAYAVFWDLAGKADYVIDLHSGGVEYEFWPLTGFYGEAQQDHASFQAACIFNLPTLWRLPHTPGVLSYEAWKRGKVAIGAEYHGSGRLSREGCRRYHDGVLRCLHHWGMIADSGFAQVTPRPSVLEGDWQLASAEGWFQADCELGQHVEEGAALAAIHDQRGEVQQSFHAPRSGVVLGLRSKAYIRSGNWAVLLGRPVEDSLG